MRNVAPSRSLVRRANQVKTLALLFGAIGVFLGAAGIFLAVIPFDTPTSPTWGTYVFVYSAALGIGALLVIIALALAIRAFTWKTDNDLAMITARYLAQYLDDRFTLIRNVSKRQIGYVDAVLVGPPGTLIFRILDTEGNFVNEGVNWMRLQATGETVPAGINPSVEAIADIRKVREFLEKRQLMNTPVYGVVVFIKDDPRARVTFREPTVPPTNLQSLIVALQPNYLAKDRIDQSTVAQIVRLLLGE
jgi:hypothetical protein